MKPAPIPDNEPDRLEALYRLLILDTPPEERFDRVVAFAAEEFDMPMAQMSLLDEDRQWAKSRVGIEPDVMPRAVSFCGHLVELPQGMTVEDASADERFADNPIVTGEPGIRFYAGAPLILPNGHTVGALCVLDRQARQFDDTDRAILNTLRDLIVNELVREGRDGQ